MSYRDIDWNGLLDAAGHRPWPPPTRPWVMRMSWRHLLFAHFTVDPRQLRGKIPTGLELDLFEGEAYVGIVAFVMDHVGFRTLPTPRPWARFCELNVRSYVVRDGKPGVWFFSLDAERRLAVEGARATFSLPYVNADMACELEGDAVRYRSERTDPRLAPGRFEARWEPASPPRTAAPGTLEHFLTERYCLYSRDRRGRLHRADVHHPPWPLRDARWELSENSVCDAHGLTLCEPTGGPLLHCVQQIDVVGWPTERC